MSEIWFCGDTHGDFTHIVEQVERGRPDTIVFLGDIQASQPLEAEIASILAEARGRKPTDVYWIPGNHDTDSEVWYDNVFDSRLADRNLHGRVANVAGVRIAGLGGVFRERIWMPPSKPTYSSADEFLRTAGKGNRWRDGLPLLHRSTIFPDAYNRLARAEADILVTHEAPGCHPQGNEALDLLAVTIGARTIFHGHTHDSLDYGNATAGRAFDVHGVGLCGITRLDGTRILPGRKDAARSNRRPWP